MAMAVKSRRPVVTAEPIATLSAQWLRPMDAFSTLQPAALVTSQQAPAP